MDIIAIDHIVKFRIVMKNKQKIDTAFTLIEKGNDCQSHKDYWGSADAFGDASEILRKLAENEIDKKMSSLYHKQSHECLNRSRDLLIKALQEETSSDDLRSKNEPKSFRFSMDLLSCEEKKRRSKIFRRTFVSSPFQQEDEENVEASQLSIEERLAALNHSIARTKPENIMKDRLKNLGVYLPYNDDKTTSGVNANSILKPTKKISDEEQINGLLSSAFDDVKVANKNTEHIVSDGLKPQISEDEDKQVNKIIDAATSSTFDFDEISEKDQVNNIIAAAKKDRNF